LTYRRLPDSEIPEGVEVCREKIEVMGRNADDLNGFRRKVSKPLAQPT
jgi:antitoxin component HigA of HigAB toxin-antitoxin module